MMKFLAPARVCAGAAFRTMGTVNAPQNFDVAEKYVAGP